MREGAQTCPEYPGKICVTNDGQFAHTTDNAIVIAILSVIIFLYYVQYAIPHAHVRLGSTTAKLHVIFRHPNNIWSWDESRVWVDLIGNRVISVTEIIRKNEDDIWSTTGDTIRVRETACTEEYEHRKRARPHTEKKTGRVDFFYFKKP